MKKFDHREGDRYELLPSPCPTHVPFRQWRDGQPIAHGVGERCESPSEAPAGTDLLFLEQPDAGGLQRANGYTTNSRGGGDRPGNATVSRATTEAYRTGWDEIFAARKPKGRAN